MIICPNCKEEIDDNSYYCDQCGQALLYCNRCGRVGMGRRCTSCGGLMVTPEEYHHQVSEQTAFSEAIVTSTGIVTQSGSFVPPGQSSAASNAIPMLTLYNNSLNLRIQGINGAVIGRRQGPYAQYFAQHMYVSGVHAQLRYKAETGWSITDKHSSNGTKVNQRALLPDVEMTIKNGDIVTIANVNLQVSIS